MSDGEESKLAFGSEDFWEICIIYFPLKAIFHIYKYNHEFSFSEENQ